MVMKTGIARVALLAVLWLPLFVEAQTQEEADKTLRARVTEFLQYHVDGNFRKAYDMVAEDTKDYYFSTGKVQLKGFKVGEIKFSDNFTKANVTGTISKVVNVAGTDFPVEMPSVTTWKIENGKWVWYKEPDPGIASILGIPIQPNSNAPAAGGNANADADLPKSLNDQVVAAAAKSILQQVSVDKKEVTLAVDKPSEDRVTFHNGMTGSVQVSVTAPELPGFTAKVEQSIVRASSDLPVVFRYEPGDQAAPTNPVTVQILVQPLNQIFRVQVRFAAAQ
jgi:hypothetical protein